LSKSVPRGLLAECGVVLPQKPERLRKENGIQLEALPGWANRCIQDLLSHASRPSADFQ